jgi:hypothetical protein
MAKQITRGIPPRQVERRIIRAQAQHITRLERLRATVRALLRARASDAQKLTAIAQVLQHSEEVS